MKATRRAVYEARARIIKALAHPARLLMVDELRDGPRCVCELRAVVGSDLSTVSKHLLVLKNAGIVQDERRGVQVYYRLRCPCATDFFECAEKVLRTTAEEQARLLGRARTERRS
jgi:ArsR family transcriptional regulator